MLKKISNTFSALLTRSYLWAFLLCWNLLDSSNLNIHLFLGNLTIALILATIFILITNKPAFSVLLTLLLSLILDFASEIKAEFLSNVLNISDLKFLFNIKQLAGEELISSYLTFGFLLYLIACLFLISYVYWKSPKLIHHPDTLNYVVLRIAGIFASVIIYVVSIFLLKSENNLVHNWVNKSKYEHIDECNKAIIKHKFDKVLCYSMGSFLNIASGFTEQEIKGISTLTDSNHIKTILPAVETNKSDKTELPNIILILNESTFDPSYLNYDFAKKLKFDFFNNPTNLKGKGIMKVHTFGGGSSLSEFPSLTGVISDVFIGPVWYPFLNMAKITKSSLFRELKKQGYYSVVIYPVDKRFINAANALKELGADKVVGIEDYNFEPEDWRDVPEKFLGEMINNEIAKAPANTPVFISVATMRNHGPHNRAPEKDIIGCSKLMAKKACGKLNDYIARLKLTDYEWMEYSKELLKSYKNTVLINFGDHLPSFEGEMDKISFSYPDQNNADIYRTFYNIRANYKLKHYNYPVLDISYLPSIILDITGENTNPFYRASSLIREKCNGLLLDCKTDQKLVESYKALIIEQLNL